MKAQQSKELDPIAVSVPEATRMLGFKDRRVVNRLIHNKDIKARKIGRVWRVNLKSLYEYMDTHGKSTEAGNSSRIIVTFESSDMTQEIGSADVSNDCIHATGVNLGINRIDKRINITDALKGIINTINSTPEVRR